MRHNRWTFVLLVLALLLALGSCIGDGEDGIWYYDGFTVYTYRGTDGSERVEDVF